MPAWKDNKRLASKRIGRLTFDEPVNNLLSDARIAGAAARVQAEGLVRNRFISLNINYTGRDGKYITQNNITVDGENPAAQRRTIIRQTAKLVNSLDVKERIDLEKYHHDIAV